MKLARNAVLVAALLLAAAPAPAAEPQLALIRVESLDRLLTDVQRVLALTGREMSREELLAPAAGALGGADLSWVDGRKPWVATLSMAALAQGPQALVVALPVRDESAAVAALGALLSDAAPDEDGVRTLTTGTGTPTATVFRNGYLVASPNRELALGFRPREALARGDLPAGSLAIDVHLEAVAPMALSGLEAGRRMVEQRIAAPADAVAGDAAEEDPAGGDAPAPEMDAAAVAALMDLYLDLLRNLISNTSRLQMSIELTGEHLILHQRVLPLAGSTLEGLLAAQRGGLPALARLVDPSAGGFMVAAGQVTFTPAFEAAVKAFLGEYTDAMGGLFEGLAGTGDAPQMVPWLQAAMHDIDRWPDCYRGDFAGSFDIDPESGFRGVQVAGARDPGLCQTLLDGLAELAGALPAPDNAEPTTTAKPEAFTYKGVRAMEYRVDLEQMAGDLEEAEVQPPAWVRNAFVSYTGLKDDLILSATGSDSAEAFRRLVDQAAAGSPAGGITAREFAPLVTGPGFFAAIDPGQMMALLPAETDDPAAALLAGLGGARLLYGLRLDPEALHAQFALPLSIVSTAASARTSSRREPGPR